MHTLSPYTTLFRSRGIRKLNGLKSPSLGEAENANPTAEDLVRIRLIAPTTPAERIVAIVAAARGFIYYVSREGVTGARDSIVESLAQKLTIIRQHTRLPIAVGFGISNPEQAATVARAADAGVLGRAVVDAI